MRRSPVGPNREIAGFAALLDRIEENGVRTVIARMQPLRARADGPGVGHHPLDQPKGAAADGFEGDDLTASDEPSRKMMRQIAGAFAEYEKVI